MVSFSQTTSISNREWILTKDLGTMGVQNVEQIHLNSNLLQTAADKKLNLTCTHKNLQEETKCDLDPQNQRSRR